MAERRGLGSVYQRGGVWWARYSYRGTRHRESSHSAKRADAVRLLKRRLGEMGRGTAPSHAAERVSVRDLADMLIADYKVNDRRSTERAGQALRHVLDYFGDARRALDVTGDALTRYVQQRKDGGAAASTVRNEMAAFRRAFNLGVRAGRLPSRPVFPTIEVHNTRTGFFEEHEFRAVLKELPEDVRPVAEFLYWSGWRKQEVVTLQWTQIDLSAGTVRLDPGATKNREGRTLPYHALPVLAEVLSKQLERVSTIEEATGKTVPHVFIRADGEPIRNFRKCWEGACKRAGVEGKLIHDCRRTAARRLVRAGAGEKVAMTILGHKSRAMLDRYNIVAESDIVEGLKKVAALQEQQGVAVRKGTIRAQFEHTREKLENDKTR